MNKTTNTAKVDNVLRVVRPKSRAAAHSKARSGTSGDPVAGPLLSNPKFATPANDEPATPRLSPQSQEGRRARLVRMWAEILADAEKAAN